MSADFRTGLFDFGSDMSICMTVCCCGVTLCPSAYSWAESRNEECQPCHWCAMAHPIWTRANIRKHNTGSYGGEYFGDWFMYACCFPCATCQDARELKLIKQEGSAAYGAGLNSATSLTSVGGESTMKAPAIQPLQQGYGVPSYTHGNTLK